MTPLKYVLQNIPIQFINVHPYLNQIYLLAVLPISITYDNTIVEYYYLYLFIFFKLALIIFIIFL